MKKNNLILTIVITLLIYLIIPIKDKVNEQITTYTSPLYRIVVHTEKDNEFQLFPKNFGELKFNNKNTEDKVENKIIIYDFDYPGTRKENTFIYGIINNENIINEIDGIINRSEIINDRIIDVDRYNYELNFTANNAKSVYVWVHDKKVNLIMINNDYYNINEDDQSNLANLIYDSFYDLSQPCIFTKTYHVVNVNTKDNAIAIKEFQQETIGIVKVSEINKFKKEKQYEITFEINKKINIENTVNLFDNSKILDIKETDKLGLDQVQERCDY